MRVDVSVAHASGGGFAVDALASRTIYNASNLLANSE